MSSNSSISCRLSTRRPPLSALCSAASASGKLWSLAACLTNAFARPDPSPPLFDRASRRSRRSPSCSAPSPCNAACPTPPPTRSAPTGSARRSRRRCPPQSLRCHPLPPPPLPRSTQALARGEGSRAAVGLRSRGCLRLTVLLRMEGRWRMELGEMADRP
jgi:hypothetical protein